MLDVRHQPQAHELIQRAISADRLHHAMVFHGPEGIGKEAFACRLAALLLCEAPVRVPVPPEHELAARLSNVRAACGRCDDCRAVACGSHPDFRLIFRQLGRQHPSPEVRRRKALDLGVDVLRHFLIERVSLTAVRGQSKVFIVREAERMTDAAQNALLKTLEEPPPRTFIILLTESLDQLLATTVSRSQLVPFRPLPAACVRSLFDQFRPDCAADAAEWYATIANGSIGRALHMHALDLFAVNTRVLGDFASPGSLAPDAIVKHWQETAKSMAEKFAEEDSEISDTEASRRAYRALFQLVSTFLADLLRASSGCDELAANRSQIELIRRWSDVQTADGVRRAILRIVEAERQLELNANAQLVVDCLANELASALAVGLRFAVGRA